MNPGKDSYPYLGSKIDVPINMGIKLFRKNDFPVLQLKHLTPKTTNLGISKMGSTIFYLQN